MDTVKQQLQYCLDNVMTVYSAQISMLKEMSGSNELEYISNYNKPIKI